MPHALVDFLRARYSDRKEINAYVCSRIQLTQRPNFRNKYGSRVSVICRPRGRENRAAMMTFRPGSCDT